MATFQEFTAVMRYMEAAANVAPERRPSAEQSAVYFAELSDLPADMLMIAARRAIHRHTFATIPPVGLIRQQATDLLDPPIAAGDAWRLIRDLVRRFGPDPTRPVECRPEARRLELDARRQQALAAAGPRTVLAGRAYGWAMLANVADDDTTAFAQFRDVYQSIDVRARQEAALPPGVRTPVATALADRIAMPALNGKDTPHAP